MLARQETHPRFAARGGRSGRKPRAAFDYSGAKMQDDGPHILVLSPWRQRTRQTCLTR